MYLYWQAMLLLSPQFLRQNCSCVMCGIVRTLLPPPADTAENLLLLGVWVGASSDSTDDIV